MFHQLTFKESMISSALRINDLNIYVYIQYLTRLEASVSLFL